LQTYSAPGNLNESLWSLTTLTQTSILARSSSALVLLRTNSSIKEGETAALNLLDLEGVHMDHIQVMVPGEKDKVKEIKVLAPRNTWVGGERFDRELVLVKIDI
jgi:hypothetical protein